MSIVVRLKEEEGNPEMRVSKSESEGVK